MDYLPVYEGEDEAESGLKISPEKVQKMGVKTEAAKLQPARPQRARQRPRRDRREPHLHGHRQVRGLHRAPVREYQRPAGRARPAAVRGLQPGTGLGAARIRARRAGRRQAERSRRRGAGRDAATRRIQPATAEELGYFRRTGQGAGEERRGEAHADLPLAGGRHRHREKGGAGHALHARRNTVPDRRYLQRSGCRPMFSSRTLPRSTSARRPKSGSTPTPAKSSRGASPTSIRR